MLSASVSAARALLEQVADPIVLIAEDGTVAYVNAAGRSWFAQAAGAQRPLGAGESYLERLRSLGPADSPEVTTVAQGLAAILSGKRAHFQHDGWFGSAAPTYWLSICISSCQLAERSGALVQLRDLTDQRRHELAQAAENERLALFNTLATDAMAFSENGIVFDCNDPLCQLLGYTREEMIGQRADNMALPEDRQRVLEHVRRNSGEAYEHRTLRKDGTLFETAILGRPLVYQGRNIRGTIIRDLSAIKETQRALGRAQEEKLQAQAALLAELSTPLIPLNRRVLVMPLIGSLDSQRAQQVLETLLTGIEQRRTHIVIIDITGVRLVDSHVASTLIRAAKASRLLGAQVVLTGIRAEVAQALVRLGVDFAELTTKGTLQDGIAYAMAQND